MPPVSRTLVMPNPKMHKLAVILSSSLLWCCAVAQTYTIQTVAGRGWDLPAASADLSTISAVAADSKGNVYMALREDAVVVRIDPAGQLTLIAGNGIPGDSGDNGPATLAQLTAPTALAVDAAGTVYIADSGVVRRVSNGMISSVAAAAIPSIIPGVGITATGIAVDSAGNLYVAVNGRVIEVSNGEVSNGIATTVAGPCCGPSAFGDNIPAVGANIHPVGIAVDGAGTLYIADNCSNRIRAVSKGVLTTVAGNGSVAASFSCSAPVVGGPDGRATSVSLDSLIGVAVDASGNVYFTEGQIHLTGRSLSRRAASAKFQTETSLPWLAAAFARIQSDALAFLTTFPPQARCLATSTPSRSTIQAAFISPMDTFWEQTQDLRSTTRLAGSARFQAGSSRQQPERRDRTGKAVSLPKRSSVCRQALRWMLREISTLPTPPITWSAKYRAA